MGQGRFVGYGASRTPTSFRSRSSTGKRPRTARGSSRPSLASTLSSPSMRSRVTPSVARRSVSAARRVRASSEGPEATHGWNRKNLLRAGVGDVPGPVLAHQVGVPHADRPEAVGGQRERAGVEHVLAVQEVVGAHRQGDAHGGVGVAVEVAPGAGGDQPLVAVAEQVHRVVAVRPPAGRGGGSRGRRCAEGLQAGERGPGRSATRWRGRCRRSPGPPRSRSASTPTRPGTACRQPR